jgi:hypothetical protein
VQPDNGDNQMNQKDEDIAHPGMVSKPEKTPNWPNSVIRHGHVAVESPSHTGLLTG